MAINTRNLVGREEELGRLLGLLDGELPWTAVIAGEAGIGKTALWLAARDEASARGFRVLSSRPSGAEVGFSFSGLADLVGGFVPDVLDELPSPQRRALEAALGLAAPDGLVDERLVAFAALGALKALAGRGPLLVGVDDAQWLDEPSSAVLGYVLPRLEREAVALLLTVRGPLPAWLRRVQPLELELGGLSLGAVHELLRVQLDATFARPTLLRIYETSGGNPFFALELARGLLRRGGRIEPDAVLPLPPDLAGLLEERLDALGPAALHVARIVAALAEPALPLVETAADCHADEGLAEAVAAGVLEVDGDRLRFTHPLLRSAVWSRSTATARRRLHARLASLVPGLEEQARHLGLAADGPDRPAAAALEQAAAAVRAVGTASAAAALAEQALRLTPDSDAEDKQRRLLIAAQRLDEAGDLRRAVALLEEARVVAPPGPGRAAILVQLARPAAWVQGPRAAIALCEEALAQPGIDDAIAARGHLMLAYLLRFARGGSIDRGLEHARSAASAAARATDDEIRCEALAMFGLLHFCAGLGTPRSEMELALALERSLGGTAMMATWSASHQLAWSGEDLERVRVELLAFRDAMRGSGSIDEISPLSSLSLLEWRAGNWERAAGYAADLLALDAQQGLGWEDPLLAVAAARVAASRGDLDEARRRSTGALERADALGLAVGEAIHRSVLGFVELSLGRPGAALEQLRPAWETLDELGCREPGLRPELGDTLEALIAVGALDEAARRLPPWEERARELDRAWARAILARCRGLLLAARINLTAAFASFDEALEEHARVLHPFEHGRTLLALGATQRRAKKRAAARATLEEALTVFEQLGAPLWAEKARTELARIGGRAPSRGELTEAERRIAELVAEGRSNRDVAAALFLTEHTVETALTRIYRKLGVRSRTELATRLARETSELGRSKS